MTSALDNIIPVDEEENLTISESSVEREPQHSPSGPELGENISPSRHSRYYIQDDMAIFLVENQYFKVHRHFLSRESDVFQGMFMCPPGADGQEGDADERAIVLPGVTSAEFESLLNFFYDGMHKHYSPSLQEWIDILSITTRFDFATIRKRAISEIDAARFKSELDPVDKVLLAKKYDIPHWVYGCYEALCQRKHGLEDYEAEMLGMSTVNRLWKAREAVRGEALGPKRASSGLFTSNFHAVTYETSPDDVQPAPLPTVWDIKTYDSSSVTRIVKEIFEAPPSLAPKRAGKKGKGKKGKKSCFRT